MGSNNTFEKIKVMLKKEFSKKDVNRARNLIMGKTDASTGTQIGYNKETKEYKEGDVWTEGRKTWTIKDGIKQTVSKLDKIRKETLMPLCCPKCGNVMKKRLDKPNYKLHKKCHDCVVEFEHKLRIKGKYNQYRKNLINKNSLNIVNEMESYLLDAINTSNSGFVSEDGVIERWVGGVDKKEITKQVKEAAKIRREHIEKELNDKEGA
jgi:bacterioferritin-associated ferredoxin